MYRVIFLGLVISFSWADDCSFEGFKKKYIIFDYEQQLDVSILTLDKKIRKKSNKRKLGLMIPVTTNIPGALILVEFAGLLTWSGEQVRVPRFTGIRKTSIDGRCVVELQREGTFSDEPDIVTDKYDADFSSGRYIVLYHFGTKDIAYHLAKK